MNKLKYSFLKIFDIINDQRFNSSMINKSNIVLDISVLLTWQI